MRNFVEIFLWFKPLDEHAVVMFCLSGNFALQPDLLACFSSVTLLFGQSWCWKVSILPMRMHVSWCWSLPAVLSFSLEYFKWLSFSGWLLKATYLTHRRSQMCMSAALVPSSVFVCDAQLCSVKKKRKQKKNTLTLCVFMTLSEPGRLRPMMMLLGSGVGVLPFTVNPVTPTGSTNCDTGTITLHCFTFTDTH